MPFYSAEEQLEKSIKALGEEYGRTLHHCEQHFWSVNDIWSIYETLFGHPKRVDMLNEISAHFWGTTQQMLFDQTLLGLCRLTDPPKSSGVKNLSIKALRQFQSAERLSGFDALMREVKGATEFCKDWRDRRIAHNNYQLAVGEASSLSLASRADVRSAFNAILAILNFAKTEISDSGWAAPEGRSTYTEDTLTHLYRGLIALRADQREIEQGNFQSLDVEYPDWLFSDFNDPDA
jgi:hypothetical protein